LGDVFELVLAEEEHVVESLAPQAADNPFGNGIHVRGTHGRLDHARANALGNAVERASELLVSISNEESRCQAVHRVACGSWSEIRGRL
jgi:hypothetical protein